MQYQIFIQNLAEHRFTASVTGMPTTLIAEGTTEAEALARAKAMLEAQLAKGKFVTLELSSDLAKESQDQKNRLMQSAGMWAEDPYFDEFLAEMQQIREDEDREMPI
jgi:predicted RNase H-like HicB family nuclease